MRSPARRTLALMVTALSLTGCHSVGPVTLPRDRADYSAAISDSWKNQMLLNIVKLRYADVPIFVDVGQIVAGYTVEGSLNATGTFHAGDSLLGNGTTVGGQGKYTDRPTITYMPLTGGRFMQELLTPIPPAAIFSAIQSGWAADSLFWLGVTSINGIRNARIGAEGAEAPDPRFERVVFLLRDAQVSGTLGIRVQPSADGKGAVVVTIRNEDASTEQLGRLQELRLLLGLREGVQEYTLRLADVPTRPDELAVQSRTLLGILQALSLRVQVPEEDVREGRASPGLAPEASPGSARHRFVVSHSTSRPDDVAVSVRYRDGYFFVDDRDFASKRSFSLIMMLFTLANIGPEASAPVLTIPTN